MTHKPTTAIINGDIYDFCSYRPNHFILFDDKIQQIGNMSEFQGADQIIDVSGNMILPGLVVGHGHLYGAFLRGLQVPFQPESFRELLEQLHWRLDAELDLESTYHSGKVLGNEYLKCGVTTLFDHHASGKAIRGTLAELKRAICDEFGMRGVLCFETSDRFPIDQCLAENIDFAKDRSDQFCGMFGMHASMSVSKDTLDQISAVIGDIPIHVHAGESLEDEEKSISLYGKRIIERFDHYHLLNKNSILAHCVHIDDREAAIIAKRECAIAINPTSNMNTSVGLPDYALFKKHGIKTIIGNDSLGPNIAKDYQNVLYCSHLRSKSAWQFSYQDLLDCIRNGYDMAERLLNIKIGLIEPGYVSDLISIPYFAATPINQDNIFGHLVDGLFNVFKPKDVWCSGKQKIQNYETKWDESKIYSDAAKVSESLWQRIGG
jgi:cytosine/adenosine deaminase-related metal-dependent hydrolase